MAKRRWFYMLAKTFGVARDACEQLHAVQRPGEELQMIWSDDHSACLVCIDGASKEWRMPQQWIEDCIEVYCRTTYPGLSQIPGHCSWQLLSGDPENQGSDSESLSADDLWGVD